MVYAALIAHKGCLQNQKMLIIGLRGPGRLYTWPFIHEQFLKDEEMVWMMMAVTTWVKEEEVSGYEHISNGRILTSRACKIRMS